MSYEEAAVSDFRIKPDWALSVANSPKQSELLNAEGAQVQFFYGPFPAATKGVTLLLYGHKSADGSLSLARGFKIYPDLCDGIEGMRPTEIFEALVNRFGSEFSIGGRKQDAKLLLAGTVVMSFGPSINPGQDEGIVFHKSMKGGGFAEVMVKPIPNDPEGRAHAALVYGFPYADYLAWVRSHKD